MKVRLFVSGSAALLAAWLGVTYVREVPARDYPELGREPAKSTTVAKPAESTPVLMAIDTTPAAGMAPMASATE